MSSIFASNRSEGSRKWIFMVFGTLMCAVSPRQTEEHAVKRKLYVRQIVYLAERRKFEKVLDLIVHLRCCGLAVCQDCKTVTQQAAKKGGIF